MASQKFLLAFARSASISFPVNRRFATSYALSTKLFEAKSWQEALKKSPTKSSSEFSTSCHFKDEKKVGLFLFGRPPIPNLDAGIESQEGTIDNLDPHAVEILEKLHQAEHPREILSIYQNNKSFMTEVHTSRALQQLADVWDLQPENVPMVTSSRLALVKDEPLFRQLCVSCLRDAQHMDDFTFLLSLRSLLKIGIPENSALIHTLLTHTQYRLNQMSPTSLALLCQIWKSLKLSTELTQALHKALILIIPKMIYKTDYVWELLAFLKTAGKKLSPACRGRLLHQLLALLKLDPSVTPADCYDIVLTLRYSNFQSEETLKEVCRHLCEGFRDLADFEIANLIKTLGQFRYLDVELMRKLSDFVCHSFEEFDSDSLCDVFDGLTSGRFYHPELASLGCRYIVESSCDHDLNVELSLVAAVSRYLAEFHSKPEQAAEFIVHASESCERFFSQTASSKMKDIVDAIDASYYLCILKKLRSPCTRHNFDERARRLLQVQCYSGKNLHKVYQQTAMLNYLENLYQPHSSQETHYGHSLPNPWMGTQHHDLRFQKGLVMEILEDSFSSENIGVNVELPGGLRADFLVAPTNEEQHSNKGLAVNVLPTEGQAVNRKGHLIANFYLKDSCLKHLGYQTLWVEASRLAVKDQQLEVGLTQLKEDVRRKVQMQ